MAVERRVARTEQPAQRQHDLAQPPSTCLRFPGLLDREESRRHGEHHPPRASSSRELISEASTSGCRVTTLDVAGNTVIRLVAIAITASVR